MIGREKILKILLNKLNYHELKHVSILDYYYTADWLVHHDQYSWTIGPSNYVLFHVNQYRLFINYNAITTYFIL